MEYRRLAKNTGWIGDNPVSSQAGSQLAHQSVQKPVVPRMFTQRLVHRVKCPPLTWRYSMDGLALP